MSERGPNVEVVNVIEWYDELWVRRVTRLLGLDPGPLASAPVVFAGRCVTALVVWRMLERPRVVSALVGLWRWRTR